MIERLIQPASSFASEIDFLILAIAVAVGFWFVLVEGVFFWFLWRFRAQDGQSAEYVTGKEKHLKRWINWPHYLIILCDVFVIVGAVRVWYMVKQDLPEPDVTVRIVGQQWAWSFVHPGADGVLDTDDDIETVDKLHVEVGKLYNYQLESRDVLHSFSVPVFRLKHDAIPGRVVQGWFEPTVAGEFDIQCAEMCGIGHGIMGARISVDTPEQHAAWLASASSKTN